MNNTAKHTPGPWSFNRKAFIPTIFTRNPKVYGPDGYLIASINPYRRANAPLIASAPAMYEALETVPLPKHNEAIGEFYTRFYTWYEGQVKQALAQAEGRHHE